MKALIFSTHTGGGHDACARAICEALEERGVQSQVMDCVAFGGAWLSKMVSAAYVKSVQRNPDGFGRVYHLGAMISSPRRRSPVYAFNSTYAFRMARGIADYGADMVVCTHLFGGQSVTHLRKHGQYNGYFAMVMTDYTLSPFMEDIKPDVLCVSNRAVLGECRAKGMPEGILQPFGIPVSPACKPCTDRAAAKRKVGLDPDTPHVLLVGGSMGAGDLPETVSALLPCLPSGAVLTLVCGSNEEARAQAEARFGQDARVRVLGQVSPLYDLMAASDVLVTKSGGLTTTEAMTIGTPMVIVRPIVGCETANAELFARKGLALYAHNTAELTRQVEELLTSAQAREKMIAAQHTEIDPACCGHFADYLIAQTSKRLQRED